MTRTFVAGPDFPAISAHYSTEDGEFVATCPDFPSLSYLAPTLGAAVEGLMTLIITEGLWSPT